MQLSKEQKLDAYTYAMLIELSSDYTNFKTWWVVCYSLKVYMNDGNEYTPVDYSYTSINLLFREFYRQKPKGIEIGDRWWDIGSPERLSAIERAIHLTEQL